MASKLHVPAPGDSAVESLTVKVECAGKEIKVHAGPTLQSGEHLGSADDGCTVIFSGIKSASSSNQHLSFGEGFSSAEESKILSHVTLEGEPAVFVQGCTSFSGRLLFCFHIPSLISNCLNLCPLVFREETTERLSCPRAPQSFAQFHISHRGDGKQVFMGTKAVCIYGHKTDGSLKSPTCPTAFPTFSSLPNLLCPSTNFQFICYFKRKKKKKGNCCIQPLSSKKIKIHTCTMEPIFYTHTTCYEGASVLPS